MEKPGVGDGNRTHNVRSHSPVLCQLSYTHRIERKTPAGLDYSRRIRADIPAGDDTTGERVLAIDIPKWDVELLSWPSPPATFRRGVRRRCRQARPRWNSG